MIPPPAPKPPRLRTTPAQWDELRIAFHSSLMIDTSLASLAQNIDGCVWPPGGPDERPSAYIDLTYDEVIERFRARGLPPGLLDDLMDILRGTLAFDESFGAMVAITGKSAAASDPVLRNLESLGIPADLPIRFCAFSPGMQNFCAGEGLRTLGEFLAFSRSASRQVIVGGEFRDLLNAVAHIDEAALSRYLPFRPRTSGLYLVESVALLVRPRSVEDRIRLARNPEAGGPELHAQIAERSAYFGEQAAHMAALLATGTPAARLVVSLDDLSLESAVAALLGVHFTPTKPPARLSPPPQKRRSLLQRLLQHGPRRGHANRQSSDSGVEKLPDRPADPGKSGADGQD